MPYPPPTDPRYLAPFGIGCWVLLCVSALQSQAFWPGVLRMLVVYLVLQVLFGMQRRSARVKPHRRQWLFIP